MPIEMSSPRDELPPESSPATVPLFPLGPWLWSSFAVTCWLILAVTGVGLIFFYQPTPEQAQSSLVELREATDFDFLRSLHFWASHALVIAAWLHVMRVFVVGSYRRLLGWTATVLLMVLVTLEAWTGSLLPTGDGGALPLTVVYGLHIVILPAATLALVRLWRDKRGGGGSR